MLNLGTGGVVTRYIGRFCGRGQGPYERNDRQHHIKVVDLVREFLAHKMLLNASGELSARTIDDYQVVLDKVVAAIGDKLIDEVGPVDFAQLRAMFSKTHGPYALKGDIARVRACFNFASKQYQIQPQYGACFDPPSNYTLRRCKGKKALSKSDILSVLDVATVQFRAMILLGFSAGFGNNDIANFSSDHVHEGWYDFARTKTGNPRSGPIWPCIEIPHRKGLLFLTSRGKTWHRRSYGCPVSSEFARLLRKLGLHRPGVGFYSLRRMCQTIGQEVDSQATSYLMGHVPDSRDMAAVYSQCVSRERLLKVSNHLHCWLFGRGLQ